MNRTSVVVGEEVTVTVRVRTDGNVPVQASVPPITGFDLVSTGQSSSFTSSGGVGTRETVWQYRLRAIEAGRGVVGPINIRVGTGFVDAGLVSVDITAVGGEINGELDTRVISLVDRAPGPGGSDDVTITLVPSADTVILGEQLDLVVVAWFPRDIRSRLRTRPTLTPPEMQGAWTYPRTSALGVADTRMVNGRLYDLYVHHQLAFPLTVGPLEVAKASVSYSLPLRTSILSREVPQEVQSEGLTIVVLPQPAEGRPQPYTGAAASGLKFTVDVEPGGLGLGEAITITAAVSGWGNVALWPEPEFHWPEGVRVYPGRTDLQIVPEGGFIGGTKTFTYLVAPDSAGTYVIPAPAYSYFALDSGRYVRATLQPIELVARGVRGVAASPDLPPPLMTQRGEELLPRLASWLRGWMALFLLGVPPLVALLVRVVPTKSWRRGRSGEIAGADATLDVLDWQLRSKLEHLVPVPHAREGDGLPAALRAAGVDASLATHASRVRDRLRGALYGRDGASDPDELAAEAREVLRALPGGAHRSTPRSRVYAASLLLIVCCAFELPAQSPSAEQLFTAGAYQAAADSFLLRADGDPGEAAHWFNAGAALFGAGNPARARVAWIKAARILPRDREIKRALDLAPPLDSRARRSTWVVPATAVELAAAGTVLWVLGWLTVAFGSTVRRGWVIVVASAVLAGLAGYLHQRHVAPLALVVVPNVALREAPFGAAPVPNRLARGSVVSVVREDGAWFLVTLGDRSGWVLADEIGRL